MEKFCELLKEKKFAIACSFLDNDINNLNIVIEAIRVTKIDNLKEIMKVDVLEGFENDFILCCTYSILSNPFNFYKLLPKEDFEILLYFCLENLSKSDLKQLAIGSIVHLSKENILIKKINGKFILNKVTLQSTEFYSLLSEYSKITKVSVNFDGIDISENFDFNKDENLINLKDDGFYFLNNRDNHLIMKDKINILTNQIKHFDIKNQVLADFSKILNHQNISVGWEVANAMAKISKYFDIDCFVSSISKGCSEIFANENLWINSLTILGILVLKGNNVGEVGPLVKKALLYDNEFVYISNLVREHSIFLVWALLQNYILNPKEAVKILLLDLFDTLVFVYIFDAVYNVKRAISSVIMEFVGVFEVENGTDWLYLIEKNYHKRIEKGDLLLKELSRFYDFSKFKENDLINKLNHHNLSILELASYFTVKFYKSDDFFNLSNNKLSQLFIMFYGLKECKVADSDFIVFIRNFKIDEIVYKKRMANTIIFLYLSCLLQHPFKKLCVPNEIDNTVLNIIQDNLFFILSKNLFPKEASLSCWIFESPSFTNKLFQGIRRNTESFIYINSRSNKFPINKYKQNLSSDNLDIRIATYKALKYVKQLEFFKDEILNGLNDYSIDRRGDISYKIRIESLYLALHLNLDAEKVFIRLFVDKSKYLREFCLILAQYLKLFKGEFKVNPIKDKRLINFEIKQTNLNQELEDFLEIRAINEKFTSGFKEFIVQYDKLNKLKLAEGHSSEFSYFFSMIEAADSLPLEYKWEFYNGISSTIINSNKKLSDFLLEILFVRKDLIYKLIDFKTNSNFNQVVEMF